MSLDCPGHPAMNRTVSKPLTFSDRYFSKKELSYAQQSVHAFSNLSLTELAQTLCEHLNWVTPKGRNRHNACLTALEKLEELGYAAETAAKEILWSEQTQPGAPVAGPLEALGRVSVELVTEKAQVAMWNEYVDRYHYWAIGR
jgi:hypothetical protein